MKVAAMLALVFGSAMNAVVVAGTPCAGDPTISIRVMTLNVKEGIGAPNSSTYEAIGDFCTVNDDDGAGPNMGLMPDIVAFQELDLGATSDLTAFRDEFLTGYNIRTASGDGFNFNAILIRPDWTIISSTNVSTPGPRNAVKVRLGIPDAENDLIVYCSHFKAFSDSGSVAQRAAEADQLGQLAYTDLQGVGVNVITMGDYNAHSTLTAIDSSLDGVFNHSTLSVPTGLKNLAVEAIAGQGIGGPALIGTFPGSNSRLDYICLDSELAAYFDTNTNGSFSQDEANGAGFVYWSGDDGGVMSNGNSGATSTASDHRPVVFDVLIPRDPASVNACLTDITGAGGMPDGVVNVDDLNLVLSNWGQNVGACNAPDITGDGLVNVDDLNLVLSDWGAMCP